MVLHQGWMVLQTISNYGFYLSHKAMNTVPPFSVIQWISVSLEAPPCEGKLLRHSKPNITLPSWFTLQSTVHPQIFSVPEISHRKKSAVPEIVGGEHGVPGHLNQAAEIVADSLGLIDFRQEGRELGKKKEKEVYNMSVCVHCGTISKDVDTF